MALAVLGGLCLLFLWVPIGLYDLLSKRFFGPVGYSPEATARSFYSSL